MANEQHLAMLNEGVEAWNAWREHNEHILPDLSKAKLAFRDLRAANFGNCAFCEADLEDADFRSADLRGADFSAANARNASFADTDLRNADFTYAVLLGANLSWTDLRFAFAAEADLLGADLAGANLANTDLSRADLIGSDLRFAKLNRTSLYHTDFSEAVFGETTFIDCDLSEAKDLEFVNHKGPSSLDIATIYKSGARIPEEFLRGCGVPESFISQIHSLVSNEGKNKFYSCFISHSFKDDEFVRRLYSRMRDAHLRVWYAPEDAESGKKLHEQIDTAIQTFDKLLIVLSEASLESEWVMTELRKAFKEEKRSGRRKLFPVRLVGFDRLRDWECFDADSGKDLAVELREYYIPDFSNWQEAWQFEAEFSRLLKALRSENVLVSGKQT